MMVALGNVLLLVLQVFFWIIIAQVVVSWLIAFDVINVRNPQAANLVRLLNKLTDWIYTPLRKFIPPIAGIDITPIIVIFGIYLCQHLVVTFFMGM